MQDEWPPAASKEEELPGYICYFKPPKVGQLLVACLLFSVLIDPSEGCLPSWFRQERSPPSALEDEMKLLAIEENFNNSVNDLRKELSTRIHYEPSEEEVEYVEEEEEDNEIQGYNTPSPIKNNPILDEYRKAYQERECGGYCFSEGHCVVHVHPGTFAFLGKECRCPPNYMGARCEEHYVKTLYASSRGQLIHSQTGHKVVSSSSSKVIYPAKSLQLPISISFIPGLAFIFIVIILAIGLATYSYKKIMKKQNEASCQSWPSCLEPPVLQRTSGIHSRMPFSPRPVPRYEFYGKSPLLLEGGQIALPQTRIDQNSQQTSFMENTPLQSKTTKINRIREPISPPTG